MVRILLVDPDLQSREQTKKLLDWLDVGFHLQSYAESAETANLLLMQELFELVLINLSHLHEEGLWISEQIRDQSNIPIVLIGGCKDFSFVRKALCLQVNDYLPSPLSISEFQASLMSIKKELEQRQHRWTSSSTVATMNVIDQVKAYVEQSLHESITLKEISNALNYNYSYLGQKFRHEENMTFNEYLLKKRMEKAKFLLEHTNLKIYEIAQEVGYLEMDWFYKKFKEHTGLSANAYRKSISSTA